LEFKQMLKRVCVFCGSSRGDNPAYGEATEELGRLLAQRGLELVFGAGHIGLMGVLADAVIAAGGHSIGVIPRSMVDRELAHAGLGKLHIVDTMHERKALMADLADAFIALPGGFGTADELFEILTWAQLGIHQKPVGLVNTAGFFGPLLAWLDRAGADGFLKPKHRRLLIEAATVDELLDRLNQFKPVESQGIEASDR
jgi:uncharacterized protein (TIGR00730 family)